MDLLLNFLLHLLAANAPSVAMGVAALFAASFLFGLLKRLLAATHRAALASWDQAAYALTRKPRAALLGLGGIALLLLGLWAFA